MTAGPDRDDDFLATSCQAMRTSAGPAALDALGWWDLLPHLDDAEARSAVFAAFRVEGRELAGSAALGGIVAQPFVEAAGVPPGTVVAALARRTARRGDVWVLVGDVDGRDLLFDQPGRGVSVVGVDAVELQPVDVPGGSLVHEVRVDLATHLVVVPDEVAAAARARSLLLGRVAAASEVLGAAERAVDLAVTYAGQREQFGQPIGGFQAVRHLLAWATTDCVAIDSVTREAVLLLDQPPERSGEVVKALAGRNGRRACERSLQVLGGIGFTAEHAHHRHHSRVLLLDSLLGTSAELSHDLGTWLRTSGNDPGPARAALLGGAR